jgi:hypothetical protein
VTYSLPVPTRIARAVGRGPANEARRKLYALEERQAAALQKAAALFLELTGRPLSDLWTVAVPEILYSMLDHFDRKAATAAAVAYLRDNRDVIEAGWLEGIPAAAIAPAAPGGPDA